MISCKEVLLALLSPRKIRRFFLHERVQRLPSWLFALLPIFFTAIMFNAQLQQHEVSRRCKFSPGTKEKRWWGTEDNFWLPWMANGRNFQAGSTIKTRWILSQFSSPNIDEFEMNPKQLLRSKCNNKWMIMMRPLAPSRDSARALFQAFDLFCMMINVWNRRAGALHECVCAQEDHGMSFAPSRQARDRFVSVLAISHQHWFAR